MAVVSICEITCHYTPFRYSLHMIRISETFANRT
jgi:hypothetical protein